MSEIYLAIPYDASRYFQEEELQAYLAALGGVI
jgi:hypothetical protein